MLAYAALFSLLLLVLMPCMMELGRRVARARLARHPEMAEVATGPLEAAIYGLFSLLLAFTFSGAAARYDDRRDIITVETNAIGTAWLRLDLLPADSQARLRPLLREYVTVRLATRAAMRVPEVGLASYAADQALQQRIWAEATTAVVRLGNPAVTTLVLGSLNDMIDITTTHLAAARKHPPSVLYGLLGTLALASAFLVGMANARIPVRVRSHIVLFPLAIAVTIYVILDMEYPRRGLIRVDASDQLLVELLDGMRHDAAGGLAAPGGGNADAAPGGGNADYPVPR